ncbi:DUF6089 family protein [Dawidia soli]|uniref:DUF6089 domain-containing protein n=1 Tax=Dawidia soli TaxID=2782352 RepID=A0AAP2GFL8_9BACT|nr:DUF6089 family protein [Dawidia soli]MBT1685236.1 hypothetical protein [Dawidia soli]
MRKLIIAVLAFVLVTGAEEAVAQMNRRSIKRNNKRMMTYRGRKSSFEKSNSYNMVSVSLNALNYYGDLAPAPSRFSTDISFTRPALGISFGHRFGPRYTLTASFMYGTLRGSDVESADAGDADNGRFRFQRNLSFRNRIKELSVIASIDLFPNRDTYISRVRWTPYVFAGLAVYHHNPQAQAPDTDLNGNPLAEAGEWVDLQPLGTEGQHSTLPDSAVNYGIKPYKRIQLSIPMGLGARFRINQLMDFSVELGFRYLFTDYIDDVSQNYVDLGVFGDNELAKAMSYRSSELFTPPNPPYVSPVDGRTYLVLDGYGREHPDNLRGNKNDRDIFMTTTFKLTYILGKSFHRAKFR